MARKSTGTVRILNNDDGQPAWHGRWTRADGTRSDWLALPEAIPVGACCYPSTPECEHRREAKACAVRMAPKVRRESAAQAAGGRETVAQYAKRWLDYRTELGIASVKETSAACDCTCFPSSVPSTCGRSRETT